MVFFILAFSDKENNQQMTRNQFFGLWFLRVNCSDNTLKLKNNGIK